MRNGKTIVVTGATGTVGKALCQRLLEKDYTLIVFSRTPEQAPSIVPGATHYLPWKPTEDGMLADAADALDGVYAVVHLASAPAFGSRWTPAYKRTLYESCILGTRSLKNKVILPINVVICNDCGQKIVLNMRQEIPIIA